MERISDSILTGLIIGMEMKMDRAGVGEVGYERILSAIVELRERRSADESPCPEHANIVEKEMAQWADLQCPKCGSYYVALDRFGYRCVAAECGWTKDFPVKI